MGLKDGIHAFWPNWVHLGRAQADLCAVQLKLVMLDKRIFMPAGLFQNDIKDKHILQNRPSAHSRSFWGAWGRSAAVGIRNAPHESAASFQERRRLKTVRKQRIGYNFEKGEIDILRLGCRLGFVTITPRTSCLSITETCDKLIRLVSNWVESEGQVQSAAVQHCS